MLSSFRNTALALIALLTVVTLAYWPGLKGGFLFDDYPNIVQQAAVHATEVSSESLATAADAYTGGRQLAMITFAIDHAFWGLDPKGYKISNLAVHLINTLLIFFLARSLLSMERSAGSSNIAVPFALALLWAAHPLQVSTVLYVVQRMEMLAFAFIAAALLLYLKGRSEQIRGNNGWHWLIGSALMAAAGFLGKETAVLFPAYALALEVTLLRFRASTPSTAKFLRIAYAVGSLAAAATFIFLVLPTYTPTEVYAIRDFTLGERLLTQLRVVPMYLGWILFPNPGSYSFYYDAYEPSKSLLEPLSTIAGAAFLATLLTAAVAGRHRYSLASLGTLWFFTSHLLTSTVIPVELVFEHRNYFGVFAVLTAVAGLVLRLPAWEAPSLRVAAAGALCLGLVGLTAIRSAGWSDPLLLAMELAERNPNSSRASTDLGEQYMIRAGKNPDSPFYSMAQEEFQRGAKIPNSSPLPEQGLIILATTAGVRADDKWWDSLIHKLESRAIGPQELSMITGFLRMRGNGLAIDDRKFAEAYLVLVNRMNMPASQYYAFGMHALVDLKDVDLADKLFARAAERGKDDPVFVSKMIAALVEKGYVREAEKMAAHARATAAN